VKELTCGWASTSIETCQKEHNGIKLDLNGGSPFNTIDIMPEKKKAGGLFAKNPTGSYLKVSFKML